MKHLFVYGTLLNDEILEQLLSFVPEKTNATLFGYKRVQVKDEVYPGIFPHATSSVVGLLLGGLSHQHLTILDNYETPHYQREKVELILPDSKRIHSETYVYKSQYFKYLSDQPWSNEYFRSEHLL